MYVCQEHLTLVFFYVTPGFPVVFTICDQSSRDERMCKTLCITSIQVRLDLLKAQKSGRDESTKEVYLTIEHQWEKTSILPSTCCICSRCFTLFFLPLLCIRVQSSCLCFHALIVSVYSCKLYLTQQTRPSHSYIPHVYSKLWCKCV